MIDAAPRFLPREDIETLTGKRTGAAQRRALDRMGIPYHARPDGRPVVVASVLIPAVAQQPPAPAPDWSALLS